MEKGGEKHIFKIQRKRIKNGIELNEWNDKNKREFFFSKKS